ncbi:MAG: nucleotidyl transferase AbiEii/AbiGii toxin family protein [Muribaculaceae bacterium]|nr:nucleotidyl transferase AbiEii/AbiGii toxin family protein [Muribaculaceae bacterium]
MADIFEDMLSFYDPTSPQAKHNATLEVIQQITLAGLQRGGFFDKAAFYGGTCLRIFHGLRRFSEDMDFTLLNKNEKFNIEDYFPAIITEFQSLGRDVSITKKDKKTFGKVESAFLKDNTEVYNLSFQTEKSYKIKIEIDTDPPLGFKTEPKLLLQPFSFFTNTLTLPDLFAGKMHALIFRTWSNRVKGRDWYDFEWFVRNGIKLNFNHFKERTSQFNGLNITKDEFINQLKNRLTETDIEMVKRDVRPYLPDTHEIEIWNNQYFLLLTNMIKFQE